MSRNEVFLSKDLSHLLSKEAKRRTSSPIKTTMAYFQDPSIVFLGAGMPSPDLFPLISLTLDVPSPPFSDGIGGYGKSIVGCITKDATKLSFSKDVPLSRALQYGNSRGQQELISFLKEHTLRFHSIPYQDWDIITTAGSTQGWDASLRIFCDSGDTILLESYTYSSSLEAAEAQGLECIPVDMDDRGIIPEKLEKLLDNWENRYPGKRMPKVLYTIPTGQNPTGCTLTDDRKPMIYDIVQRYNMIIIEDDPYYFLQMDDYKLTDADSTLSNTTEFLKNNKDLFIKSLSKSFLNWDVDGRVIRLESVSKTFAPGCRFGWMVGSKRLLDNYWNLHEVSIQSTCGFAQAIINGLLHRWGQDGYIDWLIGLRHEYTLKRKCCLDNLHKFIPKEIASFSDPVAGMFFMITINCGKHPEFTRKFNCDPLLLEKYLYDKFIENGILIARCSWFKVGNSSGDGTISFRGTYACTDPERMTNGIRKMGETLKNEFMIQDMI